MSYKRLKEKEQELSEEIACLIEQATRCDPEEDALIKIGPAMRFPKIFNTENRVWSVSKKPNKSLKNASKP